MSLAFVGLFDRIPKVQAIELTFRRWAYRSIGIPPFIKERTYHVIAADLMAQSGVEDLGEREAVVRRLHDLAVPLIGEARARKLRLELERLGVIHRLVLSDPAHYPSAGLRTRFHPMLREIDADTRALVDEVEGVVLLLGEATAPERQAPLDREQKERKRLVERLSARISTVHWDICTLMAVLVENEPMPGPEAHPVLRNFVDSIHAGAANDTKKTDRVLTIAFASIAAAFLGAWIAIGLDVHTAWSRNSALVSAIIDSLLVAIVVLPALITGLAMQDARASVRRWVHYRPGSARTMPISQYISVFGRGFLATLPLVAVFYAVFFFSIANAQGDAVRRFLGIWQLYPLYAVIGGLQALAAAYTIGDVTGSSRQAALRAAGANALAVAVAMVGLYLVMASANPRIDNGWIYTLRNWFDILRMALVCGLAIYLTSRSTAQGEHREEGRAGEGATLEAAT